MPRCFTKVVGKPLKSAKWYIFIVFLMGSELKDNTLNGRQKDQHETTDGLHVFIAP